MQELFGKDFKSLNFYKPKHYNECIIIIDPSSRKMAAGIIDRYKNEWEDRLSINAKIFYIN